jgi:DNA-binding NtrC family response regulator
VNLRLVTATNRDLELMVERDQFRRDLYYRLRVVVVTIPPLRKRRSDIPLLARHFLEIYSERFGRPELLLSREALDDLISYSFHGNVRELENVIQAAVALAPGDEITSNDLGLEGESSDTTIEPSPLVPLVDLERVHIERVLRAVDGNRQAAARILGIDRSTLYRKMMRYTTYVAKRTDEDISNA